MKLTRLHKIAIAIFIASFLPATLIANWRLNSKLTSLNAMFEKEQALHHSTDKLLLNCEKIAATHSDAYGSTHQICAQGSKTHERTEKNMALLTQESASNDINWYRNFALTVTLINLVAFFLYRGSIYLKREAD
jgi:hypothetical protein